MNIMKIPQQNTSKQLCRDSQKPSAVVSMPRSCHLKRSGKKNKKKQKRGHLKCTGTFSRCRVCHAFKFFISFRAFRSPTHTLSPTRSIFHSSTKAAHVSSPPTSGIQSFPGGCIEVPQSEKPVWLRFVLGWLSQQLRAVSLHYVCMCTV